MRFRLVILTAVGLSHLALLFTGCAADNGEAIKKILAYDPSFQGWVDEKNAIQKQLDSAVFSYDKKKREVEAQIIVLKEKKADVKAGYLESVGKITKQLNPEIRKLKQELVDTRNQLRSKETEADNIGKDIGEVSALIEKQNRLELTREETQVWNKRRRALIRRKGIVNKEADGLKESIKITKLKIKVLKIK
ncbi:MAG: hypothetical protein KJ995_05255 [Candidatus Omnitrophica bacterium]|nr:hypothetical protein [Candidatus Omnitrophota bacterium]MBU1128426.1 hypothetical protein [Candidatus Omnitrophota bacterium]MBU1784976.1 hypothetical protein [Candidatus Omnitrophota bacterium]MBU1851795.1 hypothetical protein [Candidatus Omnitrophota bacterium]